MAEEVDKLNLLQQVLPEGLPVDSNWLQKEGYSRQLIAKYLRHGWLASPVRGVYRRDSAMMDHKSWEPVVISLQRLLEVVYPWYTLLTNVKPPHLIFGAHIDLQEPASQDLLAAQSEILCSSNQ